MHYIIQPLADPRFRPGFLQAPPTIPLTAAFGKNTAAAAAALHPLAAGTNGAIFYNTPAYFPLSPSLLGRDPVANLTPPVLAPPNNNNNGNNRYNRNNRKQNQKNGAANTGYQLKVGGKYLKDATFSCNIKNNYFSISC